MGIAPRSNLQAVLVTCAPLLARYYWPGNVRELRNLMERPALYLAAEPLHALTLAFVLRLAPELNRAKYDVPEHLPILIDSGSDESVTEVLKRFAGNREATVQYLGISRTTLWRKLK